MVAEFRSQEDVASDTEFGVSHRHRGHDSKDLWAGFQPAYQCRLTGEIRLSVCRDGLLSNAHTFEGLPASWVAQRDDRGEVRRLHPHVVAGFWRSACFIEIASTMMLPLDA